MSTATATKPVKFKSTILGFVELKTYVDPHPGLVGTDRVPTPCGRCGGRGEFEAFRHIYAGRCFECDGTQVSSISVATARKQAKSDAFFAEYGDQVQAYWDAVNARQEAAAKAEELAQAWDDAHAEAAKRDAMVQGFLGNEGDKVANIAVTIQVAKYIEGSWNRSSSMFVIAKADSGHVIKIFGSSESLFGLRRGDEVTILTGKVKKHDAHDGQDQTVLSHVKVSEVAA